MTPTETARFLQLWSQGASYRAIAEAFGCALGTVASRAATLVRQGKIQPRPRGGAYPKQRALARGEETPAPPTAPAPPAPPMTPVPPTTTAPQVPPRPPR